MSEEWGCRERKYEVRKCQREREKRKRMDKRKKLRGKRILERENDKKINKRESRIR